MKDTSGHQLVSLDSQNRVLIPTRFRSFLSPAGKEPFYVSPGIEERNQYLVFYPVTIWNRVANQISSFRNLKGDMMAERKMKKHFFGNTHSVEIDGNGRVLLPNELKKYARLDKKAILVGMKDWVEVWNDDTWREAFQQEDLFSLIEEAAKQGIRIY